MLVSAIVRQARLSFDRPWRRYADQGNKAYVPFFQGLLAEIEADQNADAALARVDEALALATATGEHWSDAFLHRMRGEILLKRDPANTAPAEEAFLTAIGIAQQQKARSFELRAALSLAKLYQSNGRAADAHAVLTPALEGFSPTPEFPEIAEAQALLAALAETDEVKKAAAQRQRRLKLQTSYGQALQWSKGYVAEETKAAFKRAQELAAGTDDDAERFKILPGPLGREFYARLNCAWHKRSPRHSSRGAENWEANTRGRSCSIDAGSHTFYAGRLC